MYLRAISAYGHGADPYSAQSNLMFVYSPLVLEMMNLGRLVFPGPILWYLYLALACTASLCLPVLVSLCLGIRWLSISISILIFSLLPGFMGEFSMLSGNIAVVLYAMILSPLLFALHTNRWSWFYVAVILSALIKPPMLAFLLFPLLRGYIIPGFLSGLAVALAYLLQRLFMPALYHRFAQAVYTQLVLTGDMGFGLFSRLPTQLRTAASSFYSGHRRHFVVLANCRMAPVVPALGASDSPHLHSDQPASARIRCTDCDAARPMPVARNHTCPE